MADDVDFRQILADAGLPTTEQALQTQWQQELDAQGNPITNESEYSPFRRLLDAMIVKPAKSVMDALADVTLPSQFVKTATGQALTIKGEDVLLTQLGRTNAVGLLTVSRQTSDQQVTINAGHVVQTALIGGKNYRVITTEDVTLAVGATTAYVQAEAELPGAAYNLPAGYYNIQPNPVDGITITNGQDWLTSPGRDDETADDFRLRIRNQFNLVGDYHTDAVYRGMLSEQFGLRPADLYFQHNAPRGPGTANIYVLLPVGNPSAQFISDINTFLMPEGNHGHGDDVQAFAMPETLHDISLQIWAVTGTTAAQRTALQAEVNTFVRAAFRENQAYSPTTTQPGQVFAFSRLTQELHRQFPRIERLVFANADIQSGVSVPRINSLTVVVQ
ncbi:baseplate J/gp47 family protein [Bowmanella denitrificans]|uniref:baseplate J/gp47 family protein n=1 Tax=Bowmanella denitrificans TaxID=366582 RepID=UPI000C9B6D84|nr:baseplate J/gp47 family protein [Bowmanella denitrificans]